MPMTEDFTAFFDADEFATEATLDGVSVVGNYDAPFVDLSGIASRDPQFTLPHSAAPSVARNSVLVIAAGPGAGTWRVRTPEPDGTGLVVLPLEKQP
ncbi:MAG TPA: hypothetical protein VEC57_14525 [Candidatus Limnocylindrales bacterium]|nr:hypothetical protein [Candidatus Limnocylindrales bacterium]